MEEKDNRHAQHRGEIVARRLGGQSGWARGIDEQPDCLLLWLCAVASRSISLLVIIPRIAVHNYVLRFAFVSESNTQYLHH